VAITPEAMAFRARVERELMTLEPCEFEYIDCNMSVPVHVVAVGMRGWVAVIGHPGDASYEWVSREDAEYDGDERVTLSHSNCGYGDSVSALRDVLNSRYAPLVKPAGTHR
jgi:hypothetical protein